MKRRAGPFPILWPDRREEIEILERAGVPRGVPWRLVAPHEARARKNHGQTLARLAERGGLSVAELVALVHDEPLAIGRPHDNDNLRLLAWLKANS